VADGLLSGTLAVNSSVRSEFREISATVSTGFKVFGESAFVAVRNYRGAEKVKMSVAIFLEFGDNYSFSVVRFS
jgi:hypothetical protein